MTAKKQVALGSQLGFGFSSPDQWSRCYGEVFRIYGYCKNDGDDIYSGDEIMFYYVNSNNGHGVIDKKILSWE